MAAIFLSKLYGSLWVIYLELNKGISLYFCLGLPLQVWLAILRIPKLIMCKCLDGIITSYSVYVFPFLRCFKKQTVFCGLAKFFSDFVRDALRMHGL